MGLFEGIFGSKKLFWQGENGADHFQIQPFAQRELRDPLLTALHPAETLLEPHYQPFQVENGAASIETDAIADRDIMAQIREPQNHGSQTSHVALAQQHQPSLNPKTNNVWHEKYDRSLTNIQNHIHAIAGAVAMLDAVEHKLIAIKVELQRISDANLRIDGNKVLHALQALSEFVNDAISSVDDQCVNMLRDAKLEIRFAEMDSINQQPDGVSLTMISIDRLLDYKIKAAMAEGMVAEETPEFVNDICSIVSSNIQILTSVMLALFASRNYIVAVTKLAARERIIPSIARYTSGQIAQPTIDELSLDRFDRQIDAQDEELKEGRASLTALLNNLRENRDELGATFN